MRFLMTILGLAILAIGYAAIGRRNAAPLERLQPPPGEEVAPSGALPKLWPLPDFSLTDRTGGAVTLADLKGKVWAADFFYASCPGPCPIISTRLGEVQKALGDAPDVRLVSISTDPEKDTPEALDAYAKRFHATDRWYFLTGDKKQIFQLGNKGFKLSVTEDPAASEPITHSTKLALVDRTGFVRGFYDGTDPETVRRLVKDIGQLLGEAP